jgi:membrane-associated phospholipid phosphatase
MSGWWQWDDGVLQAVNAVVGKWPVLDKTMSWLLDANLLKFGIFALLFIGCWSRPGPDQLKRRHIIVMSIVAGFAGLLLGRVMALALPFRERPFARAELGLVLPPDYAVSMRSWSSFPSDHAVMAFALVAGAWLLSRRLGVLALAHAVLVVCLPRMYMSLHHPTDLLAGAALGAGLGWALNHPGVAAPVAGRALAFDARYPAAFHMLAFLTLYQLTTMFSGLRDFAVSLFKLARMVG